MKKATSSPDAIMAAFIQKCTAQLEEQVQRLGRWPDRLQLPEPGNDIERQALELWIEEIKEATGNTIRLAGASAPQADHDTASAATETRQIGVITVDAGLCWIGDPCYIFNPDQRPKAIGKNWSEFCGKLSSKGPTCQQFNHDPGHPGLGVVVSTGNGDGDYPVYAEIQDGRVMRVWVEFLAA
jgi:hypothetical protein